MGVQQWKSTLVRWHQLTRYYANRWQYDGTKWAERIWYGTGTTVPNAVASVPFMITRNMRAQLEQLGFPAHAISALLPKAAHELINDKVSYAQFQAQCAQSEKAQQAREQETAVEEIKEIVASIHAREATHEQERVTSLQHMPTTSTLSNVSSESPAAGNQIAIVPDAKHDATETPARL